MSEHKRSTARADQPISRHPLFPAIVALWCGALFGLASIALRTTLIEHAVVATGMARIVPMAAPPLGTTARVLLALAATGLGGIVGLVAALRMARGPKTNDASASDIAEVDAPTEPGPSADTPPLRSRPLAGRRRALAPATETAETVLSQPLLAREPQILNVAEFDLEDFAEADEAGVEAPTEQFGSGLFESYTRAASAAAPVDAPDKAPARVDSAAPESHRPTAAERIAGTSLDELSPIELLERLALAMERRREAVRYASATPAPIGAAAEPEPESAPPEAPSPLPLAMPRLATTQPSDMTAVAIRQDNASFTPHGLPAALRPVDPESFDDGKDDALPGYIPPRHIGRMPLRPERPAPASTPAPAADADDHAGEDQGGEDQAAGALQHGYSSLLDLSQSERQNPAPFVAAVKPEEDGTPPAPSSPPGERPFDAPGALLSGRPDPAETEKALREALATLQRMSGTA